MNRYDNYLSNIAFGLNRSLDKLETYPQERIGRRSNKKKINSQEHRNSKEYKSSLSWDQMSHEHRNKYLYG